MKITIEAENQVPDRPQEWILNIRIDDKPQHKKALTTAMANLPEKIRVELVNTLARQ
jgi:hypothetical protein